jgi:hypothetical protein
MNGDFGVGPCQNPHKSARAPNDWHRLAWRYVGLGLLGGLLWPIVWAGRAERHGGTPEDGFYPKIEVGNPSGFEDDQFPVPERPERPENHWTPPGGGD